MTLLADICRGIVETIRETLPSDSDEARCFLGGFWLALLAQLVVFSVMTAGAWGAGR
jgi:hypothetical protein